MVARNSKLPAYELANPYEKPSSVSVGQSIRRFFYNPETGAFMGRTAGGWGQVGLFYLVFYGALAALIAICSWVFYLTIDPNKPTWQLERSIIGTNPGLGFRPLPPEENVDSSLIWYKADDPGNYNYWVKTLDDFLKEYRTIDTKPGLRTNIVNCDYEHYSQPGQVCNVDVDEFYPCTEKNYFNYHKAAPCVFLKLNKIYGWRPDFYNDTQDLPSNMPESLKAHIHNLKMEDPQKLNTIWVSCEGENPSDHENIGPIKIISKEKGFPGYYYPFENTKGYLSPLVAVHFERPKTGIIINVECKAWARNIIHNRNDKLGSVHFELMVD